MALEEEVMAKNKNPGVLRIFLFLILFGLPLVLGACGEDLSEDEARALIGTNTYSGIQQNIPVSTVTSGGWTQCHKDFYNGTASIATVLTNCGGTHLMLACRPTESSTLTLAAHAPRNDVTFDTGGDSFTLHNANGVSWYFNTNWSWGFVALGDTVNNSSGCDSDSTGSTAQRMCWKTGVGNFTSGGRCGTATGLDSTAWERLVFTASP